jgi:hypothetical protein
MNEPTYKVPAFTLGEVVTLRFSVKEMICRWWSWRHDPQWRENIRGAVSAARKLQRMEVA